MRLNRQTTCLGVGDVDFELAQGAAKDAVAALQPEHENGGGGGGGGRGGEGGGEVQPLDEWYTSLLSFMSKNGGNCLI